MADHFQLAAEEREQRIPSGQFTCIEDRAGWAHSVLFRAGCLERVQRGLYRIAQQGRDLLTQHSAGLNGREIKRMFGVSRASPKA
jgi:restriction endonuclease Mrr